MITSEMVRFGSIVILIVVLFIYIYKLGLNNGELTVLKRTKKTNYKDVKDINEVKDKLKNGDM